MVPVRLLLSFLCCWMLLLLFGCSDPGPLRPAEQEVIMPLAVGNTWIGRTTTYDTDGNITAEEYDTLRIVAEVTVDGDQWFITNQETAYSNRSGGCWMSVGSVGRDPWLVAKYPAASRDTFNLSVIERIDPGSGLIDSLIMHSVVSSTTLRCLVPGGDFSCYQYKVALKDQEGMPLPAADFPNRDDYQGFAPGVGPVVEEHYGAVPGIGTYRWKRWELIRATIR